MVCESCEFGKVRARVSICLCRAILVKSYSLNMPASKAESRPSGEILVPAFSVLFIVRTPIDCSSKEGLLVWEAAAATLAVFVVRPMPSSAFRMSKWVGMGLP